MKIPPGGEASCAPSRTTAIGFRETGITALLVLRLATPLVAAPAPDFRIEDNYTKREVMVPMRDGIELYTQIFVPRDQSQPYPILLTRTPYGVGNSGPEQFPSTLGPSPDFAKARYIFAYQDVRGKFGSGGTFIHHPRYIADKSRASQVDESSDAYDSIDWLIKNVPGNNGRVGTWGTSAAGYTTLMSMIASHPALRAASPQAAPAIEFLGDDYRHNGAFRPMITFDWTYSNGITGPARGPFPFPTADGYEFFLRLGSMQNVNRRYFHGENPAWNEYLEHPNYDQFWRSRDVTQYLTQVRPAVLNVIGWFDQEDYLGMWRAYRALESHDHDRHNFLVVGPWAHGEWNLGEGSKLGNIAFGAKTADFFRQRLELPFFNYYLKDQGEPPGAQATVFETGNNRWHRLNHWPPPGARRNLYLRQNGAVTFEPPTQQHAYNEYVSDPGKPVPWSEEIRNTPGEQWIIGDQRFAARRPDVLVYQSAPLENDVTIAGPIIADLYFSSSGTDADFIVKLIDVLPDDVPDPERNPTGVHLGGYQMLVAGEVYRTRYRNDFSQPAPLAAGVVTHLAYDLLDKFHTFKKNHRLMVQIQSTWFPLIDRNTQTFVPNIELAAESDFRMATERIYCSEKYPSHLKVTLIDAADLAASALREPR